MKSPTSRVGIIEPEGILKGSTRKERRQNTTRITGKKLFGYSTHHGPWSPGARRGCSTIRSSRAILPVINSNISIMSGKFILVPYSLRVDSPLLVRKRDFPGEHVPLVEGIVLFELLFSNLQNREKRFLWNLDIADLLHALFTGFLLFQKLAFTRDIAAIAFGQHILAQRLDTFPGDNVRADGGLNSDIEHLPGNQFTHFLREFPSAVLAARTMHNQRQGVHALAIDEDIQLDEIGSSELLEFIIE